ncbi:MAG: TetR/AcrR family transcriptional regulator [bacterium]|nr:TetR/AcrR family transcriptional regulator [bacterium]
MRKGQATKQAILEHAIGLCSRIGLCQVSIGQLADDMDMSKSGLFAHFKSKQNLQIEVLDQAAQEFLDVVVHPAFKAPAGEPRIRQLFTNWVEWTRSNGYAGGCPFVQFSFELDDQPGELREHLIEQQKGWLGILAECARRAVQAGHLRVDLDLEQFAHDFHSLMLGYHHAARLIRDPLAFQRVQISFETFLNNAKE